MSSRYSLLMWNGRPASWTSTLPCLRMSSMLSLNRPVTWAGSDGAAMVTTALASGIWLPPAGNAQRRRRGENGAAAEAMADQDRGRFSGFAQMVRGPHQVGDVRRERRVGEIAFAGA